MRGRWRSRRLLGLTIGPTGAAILLTVVIPLLAWPFLANESAATPEPTATPASSPAPTPAPTRAPTPAPTTTASCTREAVPLPSVLAGDPCPAAILAVRLTVAPVRLPIARIVIKPGPFYCDEIWPGVGSPHICYGILVRPGQFMHGWASFVGSSEVAAVALGLDLPDDLDEPGATSPPWNATLVAVETPPAGWVMP